MKLKDFMELYNHTAGDSPHKNEIWAEHLWYNGLNPTAAHDFLTYCAERPSTIAKKRDDSVAYSLFSLLVARPLTEIHRRPLAMHRGALGTKLEIVEGFELDDSFGGRCIREVLEADATGDLKQDAPVFMIGRQQRPLLFNHLSVLWAARVKKCKQQVIDMIVCATMRYTQHEGHANSLTRNDDLLNTLRRVAEDASLVEDMEEHFLALTQAYIFAFHATHQRGSIDTPRGKQALQFTSAALMLMSCCHVSPGIRNMIRGYCNEARICLTQY